MPDTYISDRAQANRSLLKITEFVLQNTAHLRRKDKEGRLESEVRRIHSILEAGKDPADWERAKVDDAYEKVMSAAGLPSISRHTDRRNRSLRFGHQ